MISRPLTTLRTILMALLLLGAVAVGLEIWLRGQAVGVTSVVTGQACLNSQELLLPSQTTHHELRRLLTVKHEPGDGRRAVEIRVNAAGCRGGAISRKSPDIYRILMLGDDTIFGADVAEQETPAARLETFLSQNNRRVEVINAAVPGYCPLLSWLRFEQDLHQLQPDLVILHVDMSDIGDDSSFRSLLLKDGDRMVCMHPTLRLNQPGRESIISQIRQSATVSWMSETLRQSGLEYVAGSSDSATSHEAYGWIKDDPPDLRLQVRHALAPIRALQASVEKRNARLLVVTAPVAWQVISAEQIPTISRHFGMTSGPPFQSRFPFQVLMSFCSQYSIAFLDTSPAFARKEAEKLFSQATPTLSRLGMALYAHEIAEYLLSSSAGVDLPVSSDASMTHQDPQSLRQ
jgi:hypothetical protein